MTYSDIKHLVLTRFRYWKEFLIRTYFRIELNVADPVPQKVVNAKQAQNYSLQREVP